MFILLDRCSAAEIDFVHSENVSFYRNIHSAEVRNMLDLHELHCFYSIHCVLKLLQAYILL